MSKGTRCPMEEARQIAETVKAELLKLEIETAISGSVLRGSKPDAGDVDLVISAENYQKLSDIAHVVEKIMPLEYTKGSKKNPPRISCGYFNDMRIEFYVAKPNAFGAMMLFATGSGMFNVRMRRKAQTLGYRLSQYGLFDTKTNQLLTGHEDEIFKMLGMDWKEPIDREEG
ncbi:hypothetical protein [Ignavibacterium sp.]|uniref:hypothetical protein n=1 Tax=Ignavibacterium sp. TaxID=2651167 RepID=UPI00307DDB0C